MNKVAVLVLGGFVGLSIGIVSLPRGDYRLPPAERHATPLPASTHGPAPTSFAPAAAGTGAPAAGSASATIDDAQVPESALESLDAVDPAEQAAASASGVPSLTNAPKHVTFGVVFVSYAGAQGAPRDARSKADAEKLAAEVAELARTDFAAAVKKGDKGSVEDAGKMYRGILEPASEYALFSLEPDQVSAPVDTPRGFWILRRIK